MNFTGGGRGKGKVIETGRNGVVIAKGLDELEDKVNGILGGKNRKFNCY
mgnify:CR=1 FL=1